MLRRLLLKLLDLLDFEQPPPLMPPEPQEVPKADAIAWLCMPTGDPELDRVHVALIDLIQEGMVKGVRDEDGQLRFGTTPAGQQRVTEILSELHERDKREQSLHPVVVERRGVCRGGP